MSYDTNEVSSHDGAPISLYEFRRETTKWRYCSADRDITFDGQVFLASPISDSGVKQTPDPSADDLTVTMPAEEDVPQLFRGTPPGSAIFLTIRRVHYGDGTGDVFLAAAGRVVWVGTVATARQTSEVESQIVCKSLAASFENPGVRITWARSCPYILYDAATCKADKTLHRIVGNPSAAAGRYVVVPECASYGDGEFSGGFLEWDTGGGVMERRGISGHSGSSLLLYGLADGVPTTGAVYVYYGCNRTSERCNNRFDNLPNYGGFPQLPGVTPFQGRSLF